MKIPEKPPKVQEVLKEMQEGVFKLIEDPKIGKFIAKCNKETTSPFIKYFHKK